MLTLGVLGIGNAGNQVANLALMENIDTFCMNTSLKDLGTIDKAIPVFLLGDSEGAGKDRAVAKSHIKKHYRTLLNNGEFNKFIDKKDIIFVVSSTGGGTGSGISVILTDILSRIYPNKLFINIGILPALADSIGAQRNTLEYFKELKELNRPYIIFDNNKYSDMNTKDYMTKINKEIIECMLYIRGDYNHATQYGMIDDADMLKILSVPGLINFAKYENFFEKDFIDGNNIDAKIINVMKTNGVCMPDKNHIIKRMGVIVNITQDLSKYYDSTLPLLKKEIGEPFEMFEHYYIIPEDQASSEKNVKIPNRVAVFSSGLSVPDIRIKICVERISEAEEALTKQDPSSVLDNINDLNVLKVQDINIDRANTEDKVEIDKMDFSFLDEY